MIIHVDNHATGKSTMYSGSPEDVVRLLILDHPWLTPHDLDGWKDLDGVLEHLESSSFYSVSQGDDPMHKSEGNLSNIKPESNIVMDMLGYSPTLHRNLDAAQFLMGAAPAPLERIRQALWAADGDPEQTALRAYGIEVNEKNLAALRGILSVRDMGKTEEGSIKANEVEAAVPDGQETAAMVRRAFTEGWAFPVALAGKHSHGSILARDEKTEQTFLLKPGSGKQSPAAGASQERASQSRREAAFYHVVEAWNLGSFYPKTELLFIDGAEYAAMHMLPLSYETIERKKKTDQGLAQRVMRIHLHDGTLHMWAIADFVLGNPDSHGQNVMVGPDNEVALIDHGSAFAGPEFDPGHDQNSFVPYYLRVWAPTGFNQLPDREKLRYLPRVHAATESRIKSWLMGLREEELSSILHRYGINPAPTLERLQRLRAMAVAMPVDEAINRLWVFT